MLGEIGVFRPDLSLVPTGSCARSATISRVAFGLGKAGLLALLLGGALLVATSCTFGDVVIYKYETSPRPTVAPSGKIGPS